MGRMFQLVWAIIVAGIRISILISVLHRATRASWRRLTIIAAIVVFGLELAPLLIEEHSRRRRPWRSYRR